MYSAIVLKDWKNCFSIFRVLDFNTVVFFLNNTINSKASIESKPKPSPNNGESGLISSGFTSAKFNCSIICPF